jgi:hypothetical protein
MQLLKGIVIGLGVLIVLGLGLLSYGFVQKTNNPDWRLFSASPVTAPVPAPETPLKAFAPVTLNLPEGCLITAVRPDGARAYLTIGGRPDTSCNRVIVVDTVQGRVLGIIHP